MSSPGTPGNVRLCESAFAKLKREGRCRLCGVEGGPTGAANTGAAPYNGDASHVTLLTRHHLVPLRDFERRRRVAWQPRRGRKNDSRNVVPLCAPCHRRVEMDVRARAQLRRLLTSEEVAFVSDVRGRDWFSEQYPLDLGIA